MEEYDYMGELETEIDSYKLRIRKLLEEKETLIQEIDELKEVYDSNIWWQNRFKAVERDKKDYKSRIDKAIEYLTDETRELSEDSYYKVCELNETIDLLEILKGEKQDEQN